MTPKEAMWLVKVQLQKTPQNLEVARVLEDIVNSLYEKTYTLEEAKKMLGLDHSISRGFHLRNILGPEYVLDDWDLGTEANHVKNFFTKSDDDYKVLHDGTAALDDDSYEAVYNKVTGRKK